MHFREAKFVTVRQIPESQALLLLLRYIFLAWRYFLLLFAECAEGVVDVEALGSPDAPADADAVKKLRSSAAELLRSAGRELRTLASSTCISKSEG